MKDSEIQLIREFNRYYTNVIGLLDNHILDSAYSLPEARILYELAHQKSCTASSIMVVVSIDKAYLSRILTSFQKKGIIKRQRSTQDARLVTLILTEKGRNEFKSINEASIHQIKKLVDGLSTSQQRALVRHMREIKILLNHVSR